MEQLIALLKDINSCITTLRLYPPENKLVTRTLDILLQGLDKYFNVTQERGDFIVSRVEGRLIINDKSLDEKHRQNPIVISIQALLDLLDINSLTIIKGIRKDELVSFFKMVNEIKKTNLLEKASIQDLIKMSDIEHIVVDETVYIAMKKTDKEAFDEADIDIVETVKSQLMISAEKDIASVSEDLSDKDLHRFYSDPENIGKILNSVIAEDSKLSFAEKSRNMTNALNRLANLIPEDKEEYLVGLISMMKNISPKLSASFLMTRVATEKKPTLDADKLILYLDDVSLKAFTSEIEKLEVQFISQTEKLPSEKKQLYRQRLKNFLHKLKNYIESTGTGGEGFKESALQSPGVYEKEEGDAKHKILQELRTRYEKLQTLPENITIGQIFGILEKDDIEGFFNEIRQGMQDSSYPSAEYLRYFAEELNRLLSDPDCDCSVVSRIVDSILSQTDREKDLSMWYAGLLSVLEQNIDPFLQKKCYGTISRILILLTKHIENDDGSREKEQTYYAYCMLRRVERQEFYDAVSDLFSKGKTNDKDYYSEIMKQFSDKFFLPVIDVLKDSSDIKVRRQAINFLSGIGDRAIGPIMDELHKKHDWYVYRNLLIILGKIGLPSTIYIIKKFLKNENKKVVKEAVKALLKIKSPSAAHVLSQSFMDLNDEMKIRVLSKYEKDELREFLEPINNYLSTDQIVQSGNNKLLKTCLFSVQEISESDYADLVSEILWGMFQHLLKYPDQNFLISSILGLLLEKKSPESKDIIKKMAKDDRPYIKKPTNDFVKKHLK